MPRLEIENYDEYFAQDTGEKYKEVDLESYVEYLQEKGQRPFHAMKIAKVKARPAKKGERVVTYNSKGGETVNTAKSEKDWVVTSLNPNLSVMKYKNGHANEYIVAGDVFVNEYKLLQDDIYDFVGDVRTFIEITNDIAFVAPWGSNEVLYEGSVLNITDKHDIYGVALDEFQKTYRKC